MCTTLLFFNMVINDVEERKVAERDGGSFWQGVAVGQQQKAERSSMQIRANGLMPCLVEQLSSEQLGRRNSKRKVSLKAIVNFPICINLNMILKLSKKNNAP